jgi:RNA polymerase sigma-70 factor (ECF subfamily)
VTAADREVRVLCFEARRQLAVAEAGLGHTALAAATLDEMLGEYAADANPLLLGLLHETAAECALRLEDAASFTAHLERAETLLRSTGNPTLIAHVVHVKQQLEAAAVQAGLTESEAQDAVQETIISVAKDIQKFKRDRDLGSFKGWLRNITRWRIADQLRKRFPMAAAEDGSARPAGVPRLEELVDPAVPVLDALWEQQWQENLIEVAIERVKHRVKEEHFQMFDLYAVKKWPVGKVARTLGVSAGQVYLAKHRISGLIKKEIQQLQKDP